MPGKGTTDAIFAVRQFMGKHRGKQNGRHMVFIDLQHASERVPRQEVCRCMRETVVLDMYARIVQDMYEGARTRVKCSEGLTDNILVSGGINQGTSLRPYLFAMIKD